MKNIPTGNVLLLMVSIGILMMLISWSITNPSLSKHQERSIHINENSNDRDDLVIEMLKQLRQQMAEHSDYKKVDRSQETQLREGTRDLALQHSLDKVSISSSSSSSSSKEDKATTDLPPLQIVPVSSATMRTNEAIANLLETPTDPVIHGRVPLTDDIPYMVDPLHKSSRCPKTISSKGRYSSWFKERYKQDIKIFLDKDDIYTFKNYDKLSLYYMPFGVRGLDRKVLGDIMHNVNFTNPSINRPTCLRCAVVGSGGVLKGSNVGEEIDSHDFVFRLNHAKQTEKYVKDVGRKISFYGFYPESQGVRDVENQNAAFLFTSFKVKDIYYLQRMLQGITNNREYIDNNGKNFTFFLPPNLDGGRLKVTHPDFFRYIFKNFLGLKGSRPTTGAIVVFTAMHICDEVTIYGFGYDPRFTLHYYDKTFRSHTNESTGCHDIHNERALWEQLHSEGVLRLFKRDP